MIHKEEGFTLVELSSAMAAGAIVMLAFASILALSTQESSAITQRVEIQRDILMLDRYIHMQLANTMGDSLSIYADLEDEEDEDPSSSGTILRTKDIDGNDHRIAASNQNLRWKIGSETHSPIDTKIQNLTFQETSLSYSKKIDFALQFLSENDTLSYEWTVSIRN